MYDIIIAGGGVSGCVIAGKLAAADPSLKILLLEAGSHSFNVPAHVQPARFFADLIRPNTARKSFTLHVGQPSEALGGRCITTPSGRVLGGGSCVNFMVYTRASSSDYDCWENEFGNRGWGSEDLIPLLTEVEAYHPYEADGPIESAVHGSIGPLKISFQRQRIQLAAQFLDVAAAYDKDRIVGRDFNDFVSGDKYAMWAKYIDPETGRRSDAAHTFIYDQPYRPNLVVEIEKRVVRVLFEGTKAVGVEYIDGEEKQEVEGAAIVHQAFASRLVVLSAGSFGSPAILERSGIGRAEVLQENGIDQVVDLPGVGEHYMDHNLIFSHYYASDEAETLDPIFHGSEKEISVLESEWASSGTGLLSHNGFNAGCKLRPTSEELVEMGAAFQQRWRDFFVDAPDKPVMLAGLMAAYYGPSKPRVKAFNLLYYSGYPASLGRVHIAGGLNPFSPLNYEPGYFEDEGDVAILRWTYKHLREIARRMPYYRGEMAEWHPIFPEGSEAATRVAAGPVAIDTPKLRYTKEDDEAIDKFHRRTVGTAWHAAGTCAMKARELSGVLNSHLGVYGTSNLKVADLSICPENVGANTYNTALAIGLKAAQIILSEVCV